MLTATLSRSSKWCDVWVPIPILIDNPSRHFWRMHSLCKRAGLTLRRSPQSLTCNGSWPQTSLTRIAHCTLSPNAHSRCRTRAESRLLSWSRMTSFIAPGSGRAAVEIGRRVPAVLTACTSDDGRLEILRVENAQTDWRIQADICRQFGATSLLILPIHQNGVIAGVLQIHFHEPHSFPDREVTAYRVMAGLVEDAVWRRENEAAETTAEAACALENNALQPVFIEDDGSSTQREPETDTPLLASFARRGFSSESLVTFLGSARQVAQRVYGFIVANPWQVAATASVTILLAIGIQIESFQHDGNARLDSTSSTPSEIGPSLVPNAVSGNLTRKKSGHEERDVSRPNSAFRRVRVGPDEVDYIAEDVTVRYFTTRPPRVQTGSGWVRVNFGEDVTMRYIRNNSTIVSQTTPVSATTPAKPSSPTSQ